MNMHADEYAERRVMRETGSMRAGSLQLWRVRAETCT